LPLALAQALQHALLATQTSAVATTTCLDCLHSHIRTMRPSTALSIYAYLYACSQRILGVAPCPSLPDHTRQHTPTATACDSNLGSGNHDMSRLSAFAYLNDAPIHALPTYLYACSQRVLGVVPCPSLPDQTHTTPQLRLTKLALSRPKGCMRAAPAVDFCHSACIPCIRLAAASSRPLFLTDLGAAPSPLAPRPDPHDQMAEKNWWQEL
jgi:hypothetical protein